MGKGHEQTFHKRKDMHSKYTKIFSTSLAIKKWKLKPQGCIIKHLLEG